MPKALNASQTTLKVGVHLESFHYKQDLSCCFCVKSIFFIPIARQASSRLYKTSSDVCIHRKSSSANAIIEIVEHWIVMEVNGRRSRGLPYNDVSISRTADINAAIASVVFSSTVPDAATACHPIQLAWTLCRCVTVMTTLYESWQYFLNVCYPISWIINMPCTRTDEDDTKSATRSLCESKI
jgi:predicted membrane-bound mannosyltransferase